MKSVEYVLVPVVDMSFGTGWAVIRDAKTGRRVRVEPVESVRIVDGVVHLALPVVTREGPLAEVLLPSFGSCWVEPHATIPTNTAARAVA